MTASVAPQEAAARLDAALVQWDRNIAAAEARTRDTLRRAPDAQAARLHTELGVTYRLRGRLDDAVREFDASIRLRPSGSDVRVLRALTLETLGRPGDAAQSFEHAWTRDPGNAAKAYYVASRPAIDPAARDEARAFLADYVAGLKAAAPPETPPFVVADAIPDSVARVPIVGDEATGEAFALLAGGKYREAVTALARAGHEASGTRDSPRLHLARGQAAESQNRVADARREYQAALGGALAGRSVILVAIARLAQVDGDAAAAIDALTRAARVRPDDPFVRHELSAALAADGRTEEAFVELAAALLVDPRDAQAYAAIGQLRLDAARYADAVRAFDRALALAPEHYQIRYSLATAYARLGDTANATAQFEAYDRARRAALDRRRRELAGSGER
jgi:tetratricopeptide (TPR) repeat protein